MDIDDLTMGEVREIVSLVDGAKMKISPEPDMPTRSAKFMNLEDMGFSPTGDSGQWTYSVAGFVVYTIKAGDLLDTVPDIISAIASGAYLAGKQSVTARDFGIAQAEELIRIAARLDEMAAESSRSQAENI